MDLHSLRERVILADKSGAPLVWSRVTWFDPNPKHYDEPDLEAQAHDGVRVLADIYHHPLRARSRRYEVRVIGAGLAFNCKAPEQAFARMEREAVKAWHRRRSCADAPATATVQPGASSWA